MNFLKIKTFIVEQNPRIYYNILFYNRFTPVFTKKIFQKLITGVKDFSDQSLQKYLFPYTPYLAEYYEKGFFTLWWNFYNNCRFTVIHTYLQLIEITDWVIRYQ